ncbi:MAG TPA: hypothetical protein VIK72_07960 [Clostridiaceae bacterium]
MSVTDITHYDRFSYQSLYGSTQQSSNQTKPNPVTLTPENKTNSNLHFHITAIDYGDNLIEDISNGDTVEISKEAKEVMEKLAAKNKGIAMTVTSLPTSYGWFGEDRGNVSTSAPVNFIHAVNFPEFSSQDYFVKNGIINQDYVNQFNSILKDSNGNLKSGDSVLQDALNKYAELKNSISNSNLPDAESQIKQLENSLNWSVGTSLNEFANDMTQSNTLLVKSPDYSAENKTYKEIYSDGRSTNLNELFSVDNPSYVTATNIVFSAAKLAEKGIDYINNNQYDPENLYDASKLLSAMNNRTNDADSSNLSLSTLTNVISTFRGFVTAPNQVVMSEADNLASNAPSSDISAVYISLKNRIKLFPLSAFYGEEI